MLYIAQSSSLFVIVIRIIIDHIEESELVDPWAGGHNPKPIPQLLFLEELLGPAADIVSIQSHIHGLRCDIQIL